MTRDPDAEQVLTAIVARLTELGLNSEVILCHMDGEWRAAVNPSSAVMLGEATGDYGTDWCPTPMLALDALQRLLP